MRKYHLKKNIQRLISGKKRTAAACIVAAAAIIGTAVWKCGSSQEITYRETTVYYGDLVVGITESGSVDIGAKEQVFELDMSELQRADTGSGGTGSGTEGNIGAGGFHMFDQIFDMTGAGSSGNSGTIGNLTVSRVCVSVGQQVEERDILYLLEEDSVTELKEELEANVKKAKADLEAVYADQELSKLTAQYTYDSSIAYGAYAPAEYENTVQTLQDAVTQKEKALVTARALLDGYEEQLTQAQTDYDSAKKVLESCEWSRDNTDKWSDTYGYVYYFQLAQSAQSTADTLEQKVQQLENSVEQAQENVIACALELASAQRSLASGLLTADESLKLKRLACSTAQETFEIATAYLEDAAREQEEIYQEASEKWEEFSSHIDGSAILSGYSGVITEVALAEGDSVTTGTTLATLYDLDEITMTVTVEEADIKDISSGSAANISLTAFPDTVFAAEVTEISDASTDLSGNVTYEVTVTIQGEVSGLFQGMTGKVTFITKESREVLYVSNRAIYRDGTRSYVKMKDEKGNISKVEVTTGFSDGTNVEIVEGLSEGDTVLIESRVNEG